MSMFINDVLVVTLELSIWYHIQLFFHGKRPSIVFTVLILIQMKGTIVLVEQSPNTRRKPVGAKSIVP